MIKFWSYKQEYTKYRKQFLKIIDRSIQKGIIFFGGELEKFEKNFTKKYRAKYGIAVGN